MNTTEVKQLLERALLILEKQELHHTNIMAKINVKYALAWLDKREE